MNRHKSKIRNEIEWERSENRVAINCEWNERDLCGWDDTKDPGGKDEGRKKEAGAFREGWREKGGGSGTMKGEEGGCVVNEERGRGRG
jgi:hypothetical protein